MSYFNVTEKEYEKCKERKGRDVLKCKLSKLLSYIVCV
jgi:hypothetical protein